MTTHRTGHRFARRTPTRRGNTMVLVAGILVLLVIVATAFLTRTQGGRTTAVAVRKANTRTTSAEVIGRDIAQEIADHLFVRPVRLIGSGSPLDVDANTARLEPAATANTYPDVALRYGVDPDYRFKYNFAPYQTVPYTNPPDDRPASPVFVWKGLGAPSAATDLNEGNPIGFPGMGDTRWLRDLEPLRWDTNTNLVPDSFKYWRHLTNIARPDNGWRVVRDISDVFNANGNFAGSGLVLDLNIPIEQWPVVFQPSTAFFNPSTGRAVFSPAAFQTVWELWTGTLVQHQIAAQGQNAPANYFDLNDLNGNGIRDTSEGGSPGDEFVRDTLRWNAGRYLADADGDGKTDSFWFLAPGATDDGVRQVVAVSITDNSARLNANVATRFVPETTAGETPADLALVGAGLDLNGVPATPSWNVGYLDAFANRGRGIADQPNQPSVALFGLADDPAALIELRWDPTLWGSFLDETGVFPNYFPDALGTRIDRRFHWLFGGSVPFEPQLGLTPFNLNDEFELRMYEGQNVPWMYSRFERALNLIPPQNIDENFGNDGVEYAFLRSDVLFEETTPYREMLSAPEMLHDPRHRLTLFSGARNDMIPPWLRWRWNTPTSYQWPVPEQVHTAAVLDPQDLDGNGRPDIVDRFLTQSLSKLDLREWDRDRLIDFIEPPYTIADPGRRFLHERMPWMLTQALSDGDWQSGDWYGDLSYGAAGSKEIREMAAAFTANILAYRDRDQDAPIHALRLPQPTGIPAVQTGAVKLPQWERIGEPDTEDEAFLGMERQPFLVEAFVAHVYQAFTVPPGYFNSGQKIFFEDDNSGGRLQHTVVAVQIANPYDRPLRLVDPHFSYEIDLFNEAPISISAIADQLGIYELPPATSERPSTMILYSIPDLGGGGFGGGVNFKQQWIDFLDLDPSDHPLLAPPGPGGQPNVNGTIIVDLRDPSLTGITPWSDRRDDYDSIDETEDTVRLVRVDYSPTMIDPPSHPARVVIDRFDDPEDAPDFASVLREFGAVRPPLHSEETIPPPMFPPMTDYPDPNWQPTNQSKSHWTQYVGARRAWGYDFNGDWTLTPDERNPRFVYGKMKVVKSGDVSDLDPRFEYDENTQFNGPGASTGRLFNLADDPDAFNGRPEMPWFTLDYELPPMHPQGVLGNAKPCFFAFNHRLDAANPDWSYPDKGFYHSRYAMQMLQKDADFQQVGEVLNVWLYGHKVKLTSTGTYEETERTFSEYMKDQEQDAQTNNAFINRLSLGESIGWRLPSAPSVVDPPVNHAVPILPAGLRVLDLFVCDGPGHNWDPASVNVADVTFKNAGGFSGRITPGLININTAPIEVLRTLPNWYKLVHADAANWPQSELAILPRSALPEATVSYRERFSNDLADPIDFPGGANYENRHRANDLDSGSELDVLRGERGFATPSELLLLEPPMLPSGPLTVPAVGDEYTLHEGAWRMGFAASNPFELQNTSSNIRYGARLATDVNGATVVDSFTGDGVSGDAEEANLLFAGASNLVTTRSDVFTVHFRVRSFRRNPTTGVWDATDPEYIVEDARYVMLVDRSRVDRPGETPKILYLRKLPN